MGTEVKGNMITQVTKGPDGKETTTYIPNNSEHPIDMRDRMARLLSGLNCGGLLGLAAFIGVSGALSVYGFYEMNKTSSGNNGSGEAHLGLALTVQAMQTNEVHKDWSNLVADCLNEAALKGALGMTPPADPWDCEKERQIWADAAATLVAKTPEP